MSIELSSDRAICGKCGTAFGRRKGNFSVSYAKSHRGIGYLPICKNCVEDLFNTYLAQCDDVKKVVRQMCRKLDLYWSEHIYEMAQNKSPTKTIMTTYITKLNTNTYAGRSYDDTLSEEGVLWVFDSDDTPIVTEEPEIEEVEDIEDDVSDEIKTFWGAGYTPSMYHQLEERLQYWKRGLPEDMDTGVGTEALIKQICFLELDINRERSKGKNIDKLVAALNNLIGSLNLKPSQIDSGTANTPLGVWLYRYENERPLPKVEDENAIRKTVFTWMGHVCKMLGKKNAYVKLYEDEIDRLRVERPEFDDEDDEEFMMDLITSEDGGDDE